MKNKLYYKQLLTNFNPSSIPFLTLCARDHTFNLRQNAPFSPTPNFFLNLIITILPLLTFIPKLPFYLYQFQVILLISFHFIPFSPTKHTRIMSRSLGCMYVSSCKEVSGIVVGLSLHASVVIAVVKFTSFLLLIAHSFIAVYSA